MRAAGFYQARATVYSPVNLPIFQLTAQLCAEMVPQLLRQHGRTGRCALSGAAKTVKQDGESGNWGRTNVAIAPAGEPRFDAIGLYAIWLHAFSRGGVAISVETFGAPKALPRRT